MCRLYALKEMLYICMSKTLIVMLATKGNLIYACQKGNIEHKNAIWKCFTINYVKELFKINN